MKLSILTFCFHTPQWEKFSIAVNWLCTSCGFSFLSLLEVWFKLAAGASLIYLTHFCNGLNASQTFFSSWCWWMEQNPVQNWVRANGSFCCFLSSYQYFSFFPWLQESLLTCSYNIWSIKPSIHELVVDLSLCSLSLTTAGLFKACAIGQAQHDHEYQTNLYPSQPTSFQETTIQETRWVLYWYLNIYSSMLFWPLGRSLLASQL